MKAAAPTPTVAADLDPTAIRAELDAVLSMARTITLLFPRSSSVSSALNFLQKLVDTPGAIEAVAVIINDIEAIGVAPIPTPIQPTVKP